MDDCRFDNWTRMLGALQDRRTALKEVAAAGAALVALAKADLGFAQEEGDDVLAEGCRRENESCSRNNQCCSEKCKRKRRRGGGGGKNGKRRRNDRDGRCTCLKAGRSCRKDAACCKGRCDPNDRRCRCVPNRDICNKDDDCCGNKNCNNGFCGN